jgi:hypothetical protein
VSTRANASGPKGTVSIWLKTLGRRKGEHEQEGKRKRIPGGIYHRFAKERVGKLGAGQTSFE